jgi:hypothetical protein
MVSGKRFAVSGIKAKKLFRMPHAARRIPIINHTNGSF